MHNGIALERITKDSLKQIAQGLEIDKFSTLKKEELINLIREKRKENEQKKASSKEHTAKKHDRPDDAISVTGILDIMVDGFGFLRVQNFSSSKDDIYVSPTQIQRFRLKTGDKITGDTRPNNDPDKYSPLLFVKTINDDPIDIALKRRPFEYLTPIYPTDKISLSINGNENVAARVIDLVAPIGKGQRGMIVAPPKAGKTTIIKSIAQAIAKNNPEIYLIILLIDERPEEVTDIRESVQGADVISSTFDQPAENHCRMSQMVLEHAQRLVEQKKDVVILLDSITRLARAYNLTVQPTGRTLSGGLDPDALYGPKKFFGSARNIREGGSLTILATALVETGSRMDDVIFEEFKGTGNMELRLDRTLQERRIFPAIDVIKSGTRREETLLTDKEQEASWQLRRNLSKNSSEYVNLLKMIDTTKSNDSLSELIIKTYQKR